MTRFYNIMQSTYCYLCLLIIGCLMFLSGCSGKAERVHEHFSNAQAYMVESNFEKARVEFKNVLQIDPKHVDAIYGMGEIFEALDDPRRAVGQYLATIDLQPDHIEAKAKLARLYFLGAALDRAEETANEILAVDAENSIALSVIAAINSRNGNVAEAIKNAEMAYKFDNTNLDSVYLLASLYEKQENRDKSIAILNKAIAVDSENTDLMKVLAEIYRSADDSQSVIKVLNQIIKTEPEEFQNWLNLAKYHVQIEEDEKAKQTLQDSMSVVENKSDAMIAYVDFLALKSGPEVAIQQVRKYINSEPDDIELRFALANIYLKTDDISKAETVYKEIIELDYDKQSVATAKVSLAKIMFSDSRNEDAETQISEVLKENSRDNNALLLRAEMALANNEPDSAISDYRTILKDHPESSYLLKRLAAAHLLKGETALAIDNLKQTVKLAPNDIDTRERLARILLESGNIDEAVLNAEIVLKMNPEQISAYEILARARVASESWQESLEYSQALVSRQPDSALGYYLTGVAYHGAGDFGHAEKNFKKSLELKPDSFEALNLLVRSYLANNEVDKAIALVNQAIANNADNFIAHNILGELNLLKKNPAGSEQAYRTAIRINPKFSIAYQNLATLLFSNDAPNEAEKVLKDGIGATNNDIRLMLTLARFYESGENFDKAIEQYENILSLHPDTTIATNNLAMILATYNEDEESLERANELALKLRSSNNPAFLDTVGWVSYKRGEYQNAITVFERANMLSPDTSLLLYHLGMAQYKHGDNDLAQKNLKQALALDNDFHGREEAENILAQLISSVSVK